MRHGFRRERLLRDRYGGSYLPMVMMLIVLFAAGPWLATKGQPALTVTGLLELAVLFLAILGATDDEGTIRKVGVAGIIAVGFEVVGNLADQALPLFLGRFGVVAILLYVHYLIVVDILPEPRVTISTIFGSVGTYMLAILYWATIYSALQHLAEGAFSGAVEPNSGVMDFLYFSMITQTTVGFGDIAPVAPFARSMVGLEAVTGQLYIAIIVAWLVGRAVARQGNQEYIMQGDMQPPSAGSDAPTGPTS